MKKNLLFAVLITASLLLLTDVSFSQSATWDYTVTGDTCSAIDMTGATNIGTGGDETGHQINWPFTFNIYNSTYTTSQPISWNSNGYFRFDGLVSLAARNGIIPTTDALYGQFVSYGGNTDGKIVGSIFKKITGTAPSRILTIAFTYYTDYSGTSSYHADIQINFHESSNVISVTYHNCGGSSTPANFIGMNAGDGTYGTNFGYFPTSDTCINYTPGTMVSIDNPTSLAPSVISSNQIYLSWLKNAANQNVMIAVNSTNSFGTPVTGVSYSVGNPLGTNLGTILYIGSGTSFNHMNLTPNTQFYYKIWSYNGTPVYSSGVDTFATTMPVSNPSNFSANAVSSSQIDLSWIKNAGNNDILIAYNSTNLFAQPVDLQTYLVGNQIQFGQGTVVYSGSGTTFSHTSLPSGTHYYKAWSFDGSHYYSLGVMGSATTVSINNPSSFSATTSSATEIDLAWTKNSTNQDIMIVKNTLNNFITPSNGYTYWVGAGLGPNAGSVIYMGSGTAYTDTGLTFSTAYFYKAYSYDVNHYYSSGLFDSATTMDPGISVFPYSQDFENTTVVTGSPVCDGVYNTQLDWENVTSDDNDWIPRTGPSYGNWYTGPLGDNTTGSGKYVYVASYSLGTCFNKTSYLVSPLFNFANLTNPSLEFYYHMYGATQGTISVQISTNGGNTWSANIWSISGQQHNSQTDPYSLAHISLTSYAGLSNIRIRIKGLTSYSYKGNMAIDDIAIFNSQPMIYASSTCSQNTEPLIHGLANQEVMQIKVVTTGDQSPISINQFTIGTNGTTSLFDISNAKIYYTGSSSVFATTNQFGSTVSTPTASFPVTGSQALVQGNNYFWLTYDIPLLAVFGNDVDACCTQITVDTSTYTPSVTCPAGNKEIKGYKTIAVGNISTYYLPLNYQNNSGCEMIYTSAEIGTAKDISKLAFYKESGTNTTNDIQNVSIYIKNTTASTLATGSYSLNGYTQVYSGAFPNNATNGWMEISFSTVFTYDGTSNVQILVVQQVGAYFSYYPYWRYGITSNSNRCRYAYSYSTPPESLTLNSSDKLPNIRFEYSLPTGMTYSHCTTTQADTSSVNLEDINSAVLRMNVFTNNSINPLYVNGFTLNTNGTSNLSDISNAKIFYTGNNNTFSTSNQFGTTIPNPGLNLTFGNDSTSLEPGNNYFWLTYDISATASFGNYIDAECTAIIVDDTSRSPIVTAPVGKRQIRPYIIVGTGTANKWEAPLTYQYYNGACEMIYLQSELKSGAKDITTIAFEKASGINTVDSIKSVTIYMKHTSDSTLSSGGYSTNGYTQVYNGSFTNNALSGWMEVPLDILFAYNGTQNLEVLVVQSAAATFSGYPYWSYSNFSPNRCRTDYLYAAPPASLTSTNQFPNTRFGYTIPTPMVYVSSETTQNDTSGVLQGVNNQMVIGIEIVTNGSLSALSATSFNINTNGTTSLSDISNAKLFYTGTSSVFATTNQFGSTTASPTNSFVINGNQTLMNGVNHFWLTYDIATSVAIGHKIDAECTSINVGGVKTPTVTAPQGSRMVSGALSGAYTIGNGGDYANFTSAITALNVFGINGAVAFDVISGTYNEQLLLMPVTGASSTNTITFQSQSGDSTNVILQYNNSSPTTNYTIKLNGADYITFNGITVKALGTTYSRVVEIGDSSDWNVFSNNQIISINSNGGAFGGGFYSYLAAEANDNHIISNFIDINAYYTFSLRGGSLTELQQNTLIENNIIKYGRYGIYAWHQNNIKIKSNTFNNIYPATVVYGMYLSNCDGKTEIIANKLELSSSNTIHGLYLSGCNATQANPSLIANNFIYNTQGNYGDLISYTNSSYFNFYNNNLNASSGGTIEGLYLTSGNNVEFVNNIVSCPGGGYTMYIPSASALVASDYNNLFTAGNYIGRWGSSFASTLDQWQVLSSSDANSISTNPMYTSVNDLHVNNFGMDNLGTPIASISDDIDGEVRHGSTPDIGADEFQADYDVIIQTITAPAYALCSGNHNITANIKNNGDITLNSLTINWKINNIAQTPYNWTGSLLNGATASVTIGSYNFASGSYSIIIQTANPNGQPDQWIINDTLTKVVTVYGIPTISAGTDTSICSGSNYLVSTSTGTNYSALSWTTSGTGTWTNGTSISPTYTPSPADTSNGSVQLIVAATGYAGCGNSADTMNLIIHDSPIATFSGLSSSYCPNEASVILSGFPIGGTFSGLGINGNTFDPSAAGPGNHAITYTKTNSIGCSGSSINNTTVFLTTNVTLSGLTDTYCMDASSASILISPTGGTLSGNGVVGSSFNPSIAGVGAHTITYNYQDVNGCSYTVSDSVTVNPLPSVSFSGLASVYCSGDSNDTLTANPIGGTFSGIGVTGSIFSPSTSGAGTYSIIYTYQDINSCLNSDTQSVVVNASPTANFTGLQAIYCADAGLVSLSGTPSGGIYSGNGIIGITGGIFDPSVAGSGTHTISYSYTAANSCTDVFSQNVTVYSSLIANAGNNDTVLYNHPKSLNGSVTGGSGNNTFSWSPVSLINGNANIQNPTTINLINTSIFTLLVIDTVSGCQDTTQVTITPFGGPLSANASATPDSICTGSSTQLNALASGGTGTLTYAWSSAPAGFTSSIENPVVSPTVTTTYTVSVTLGSQIITSSISVYVTAIPPVSFSGLSTSYCTNTQADSLIGFPVGGIFSGPGINGIWFDPTVAGQGNHTITYTFYQNGCSDLDTNVVEVNPAPTANAGNDITLTCGAAGQVIGDTSVLGLAYSWTPSNGLSAANISNPMASPSMTTLYTVTVLDSVTGCQSTDDIFVSVTGGPTAVVSNDTTICYGSALIITASGGTSYLWSTSETTSSIVATPTISSVYVVTVYDAGGCADSDTVLVDVNNPSVNLGVDTSLLPSQSIVLDAGSGFASYLWSNNATTQTITVDTSGIGIGSFTYSVTVTDNISCMATDSIEITFVNTGINDITTSINLNVFPNPTSGSLVIKVDELKTSMGFLIINNFGQQLISPTLITEKTTSLNLSSFPKGIYYIRFISKDFTRTEKIILE